jgi:alkylation response protein AidB-like acyl-CoA dehydrogenase
MERMDKEREMVRELATKTAQKVIAPHASEIDATEEIPKALIECMGKQGLLSILLPDEYGGINGDLPSLCIVVEEIAKVSGSVALFILAQSIGTLPLSIGGSDSQKEWLYPKISQENTLMAIALNEEEGEFHLPSLKTFARKDSEGYLLNGEKCSVTNGGMAQVYTVFAQGFPKKGEASLSAFLIEGRTSGIQFGEREKRIGMKGVVTADLILKDCRIPGENLLGKEGEGERMVREILLRSRPPIGALAVGLAQGAIEYAIQYANGRIQFGKPISSFQAIQFMIADMATQAEAARVLIYQAAEEIETYGEDSERLSAIAKIFATDVAMKVTTDAVQILGGYGYMRDYPVERMMRDAKVTQLYGESNQSQRWLIARHLMRE